MEQVKNNEALRQTLGEPDLFRLKYHCHIRNVIQQIILDAFSKTQASAYIEDTAEGLPLADQPRFVKTVDDELSSLHEGNFGRYRVRPLEYQAWREVWNKE